jgi:hypothetical protein
MSALTLYLSQRCAVTTVVMHFLLVAAQILEQDLPSGVPIVLLISDIRTRSGGGASSSKPDQRQQQGPASRTAAAAAADTDVMGMQLSDGWYYVNTMIDGPTTELIVSGKLQVGLSLS